MISVLRGTWNGKNMISNPKVVSKNGRTIFEPTFSMERHNQIPLVIVAAPLSLRHCRRAIIATPLSPRRCHRVFFTALLSPRSILRTVLSRAIVAAKVLQRLCRCVELKFLSHCFQKGCEQQRRRGGGGQRRKQRQQHRLVREELTRGEGALS